MNDCLWKMNTGNATPITNANMMNSVVSPLRKNSTISSFWRVTSPPPMNCIRARTVL